MPVMMGCPHRLSPIPTLLLLFMDAYGVASIGGQPTVAAATTQQKSFKNYKLVRIRPETLQNAEYLRRLQQRLDNGYDLDFWQPPAGAEALVDVLVSPSASKRFFEALHSRNITDYHIVIADLERAIAQERTTSLTSPQHPNMTGAHTAFDDDPFVYHYDRYNPLSKMMEQLHRLRKDNPSIVSIIELGKSHENRSILTVRIATKGATRAAKSRPTVWIDAGIHAREWIAPATAMNILQKLITGYNSNEADIKYLVESLEFYITPCLNPDGYEYSHTSNRMWRKNRRPAQCNGRRKEKVCCAGVDLNRNFDWFWASTGSSNHPCHETYHGASPFSEPETMALKTFLNKHPVKAYLTLHSYSQLWLIPFGHKKKTYPEDFDTVLKPLALKAVKALAYLHHTKYITGTGADILYEASGASHDYAKGTLKTPLSYLVELRPQNSLNSTGFLLPEGEIYDTGEETWAAVKVIADEVLRKFAQPRPTVSATTFSSLENLKTPITEDPLPHISPRRPLRPTATMRRTLPPRMTAIFNSRSTTPQSSSDLEATATSNGIFPNNHVVCSSSDGADGASTTPPPREERVHISTVTPESAHMSPSTAMVLLPKKFVQCRDRGSYCRWWKIHNLCDKPRVRQLCSLSCLPECQI